LSSVTATYAAEQKLNMGFDALSVEDGLSQESVYSIIQDRQGFIWMATQEGLNRFDGHEYKVYVPDDSRADAISHYWIWDIIEDKQGYLWIGTDGGGLDRYNPKTDSFENLRHDPKNVNSLSGNKVRSIFQDSTGMLWIATNSGLDRLDPISGDIKRFQHKKGDITTLSSNRVRAITEDHNGNLWVGTDGGGLNRLDHLNGRFLRVPVAKNPATSLPSKRIYALTVDSQGYLWIGTYDHGVSRYHPTQNRFQHFSPSDEKLNSLADNKVKDIFEDSRGHIWFATNKGLDLWQPEKKLFLHYRDDPTRNRSLIDDRVLSIYEDSGGVLWVGTMGGISKWNPVGLAFSQFHVDPGAAFGLTGGGINAVSLDIKGNLWAGTDQHGLNYIDRSNGDTQSYSHSKTDPDSLSNNSVKALWQQDQNHLWLGTLQGLDRLHIPSGKFTHFKYDTKIQNSLTSNLITSLHPASDNGLWIGTFGGGLNFLDFKNLSFRNYRHQNQHSKSLSSDRIISLLTTDENTLWVGTFGEGLNRLDLQTGEFNHFKHDKNNTNSISDNTVWSIYQDSAGTLWVGTQGGGLNCIKSNSTNGSYDIKRYGRREGMLSNTVYGIVEGDDGDLWLSTNKGLARFSPKLEKFQYFGVNHGLQGSEFNAGAFYRAGDGELFFGGKNGINAFYPRRVLLNDHRPDTAITKIYLGDKQQHIPDADSDLKLEYNDYLLSIEYAGLDFAQISKNSYEYRLTGYDKDWIDAGQHRRAIYTRLPAGNYIFEVRSANNDGLWNKQSAKIQISVAPAPWLSWWAYSLYTIALLLVIAALVNKQAQKLRQQQENSRQLENLVEERTFELADRNQQLLSLNNKLQQASITDSLTGLKNRRYLQEITLKQTAEIDREFEVAKLHGKQRRLFFGMIDLNKLKMLNDTYGHEVGDKAIVHIANILKQECRLTDTIVRWGGDEFMVLGHVHDEITLERIAERIRSTVESTPMIIDDNNTVQLSCAIGLTFYPFCAHLPKLLNWEQITAIADRAMYLAKEYKLNDWVAIFSRKRLSSHELYDHIIKDPLQASKDGLVAIRTSRGSFYSNLQPKALENVDA